MLSALRFRPSFQGTVLNFRLMVSGFRVQSLGSLLGGSWIKVWDVGYVVKGIVDWILGVSCKGHSSGFRV